jgi:hypothetical protein
MLIPLFGNDKNSFMLKLKQDMCQMSTDNLLNFSEETPLSGWNLSAFNCWNGPQRLLYLVKKNFKGGMT